MVSVIIPVYNGEKHIRTCLDSVFSAMGESEVEVIAVNDGSKDASSELLHAYAENQPFLKVIDKENGGAARARQTGLLAAKGEFIAFLDIDDRVFPGIYDLLEQKANETQADVVVFDYVMEYPDRAETVKNRFAEGQSFPMAGEDAIRYMHHRQAVFSFPWNKLYRATLFEGIHFPEKNFVGEDYNMLLQIFAKTDRVEYLAKSGYYYVMTDNSASRGGYGPGTQIAYENYRKAYAACCEQYPERVRDMTNYLIVEYMSFIIAMGRNQIYDHEMIAQIKQFIKSGFGGFMRARYVPLTMKGSAVAVLLHYRLLIAAYRLLKH